MTDRLPDIPGGWIDETVLLGDVRLNLTQPADPDVMLDDPLVRERFDRDGIMPYWAYLWPAAQKMAELLLTQISLPTMPTLELGAGLGLVGLAALARGMPVTFSDCDEISLVVAMENARQNGFTEVAARHLDWNKPWVEEFPIIIGCDLLFEEINHEPILRLLDKMLAEDGICWLGEPGRQAAQRFPQRATESGLHVIILDEQIHRLPRFAPGEFQVIQITKSEHESGFDFSAEP